MKSLIIPIKNNQDTKAKIKLICNHLNIHNQNELNVIQAIYNITQTITTLIQTPSVDQTLKINGKPQSKDYTISSHFTPILKDNSIILTEIDGNQYLATQKHYHVTQNHPKPITQKLPFKNNQQTQNQIISQIIHILPADKTKQLTNSAINMIINRLHKKGALIRIGGYYSLIPAFNDLESREQIVFRFEKG